MTDKIVIENFDGKGPFNACSYYRWRLDWLEKKVAEHHKFGRVPDEEQYQRWWEEEHKMYENNLKNQKLQEKLMKNIGVIVPAHAGNVIWLRACLESLQKLGYFVLLAYDNSVYNKDQAMEKRLPPATAWILADSVIVKHYTWGGGVGLPHAWNMFYGLKLLEGFGFDYIFNLNGDCILEKPENFPQIIEMLGDGDLISCEWISERKYCGTMSYLCKTEILVDIWTEYIKKVFQPNIGNAEARMGRYVLDNKCKVIPVENPEDSHFKPPGTAGTWRKVLGLRHLHAEHKVRRWNKMDPVEQKYFDFGPKDIFMGAKERDFLLPYWKTGDRELLKGWWS